MMKITAVCLGSAERLPGKSYKTGIFKAPVRASVMIDREGLVGDSICNRRHHGGLDQAIYGMGAVDLDWWSAELGRAIAPGTFGENLVISGLDSREVSVGDRFELPDATLEVTSTRIPCATFAARMDDPRFVKHFTKAGRPGFYCRVLRTGMIAAGDAVSWQLFAGARVTMTEMLATFGRNLSDDDRKRYLAAPIHHKLRAALELQ